jgi:cbb3-type cytochrome oxidase subunit 1
MRGVSFWFFFTATIYVSLGMIWGIEMSISEDHTLAPVHAHLNLIGWVTMALFGLYYHLVPASADTGLARFHFVVATSGLLLIVPGIVLAITERGELLAKVGSILTLISMLTFVYTVAKNRDSSPR